MRHLTRALMVIAVLTAASLLAGPALTRWRSTASQTGANVPPADRLAQLEAHNIKIDKAGDRQLLLAIARLEQRERVTAHVVLEAHVDQLPFTGTGSYLQQGRGAKRHLRWLVRSQRDGVQATLLQSSDGRFLWTDRRLGSGRSIERVDLWELRRQAKAFGESNKSPVDRLASSAPFSPQVGASYGGLPMLLESLREHFEFTAPRTFRAPPSLQVGEQAVLGMVGRWRPEALAAIVADTSDLRDDGLTSAELRGRLETYLAKHGLPSRMPHHVLLLLGERDLFPYLIDYCGASDPLANVKLPGESLYQLSSRPLSRLIFDQVNFDQPIDTREFEYEPPLEPAFKEGTEAYVRRLELLREVKQALASEQRVAVSAGGTSR